MSMHQKDWEDLAKRPVPLGLIAAAAIIIAIVAAIIYFA